jgi:hypothetical protein
VFRIFRIEVRYTSIIIALVGFVLFLVPWNHGDAHEIRVAIATAILTIGVIGLINDAYLHRSFTEEALAYAAAYLRQHFAEDLFTSLGLARDFLETGVQRIDVGTHPDWDALFENASRIQCLIIEPTAWMADQWPALITAARSLDVAISIYVPHPAHPELDVIAQRYDLSLGALRENVADLRRRVEQEWDAAKLSAGGIRANAELRVKFYRGVPGLAATLADRRGVLFIHQSLGATQGEQALVVTLDADSDTALVVWVREQLDELEKINDDFYGPGG